MVRERPMPPGSLSVAEAAQKVPQPTPSSTVRRVLDSSKAAVLLLGWPWSGALPIHPGEWHQHTGSTGGGDRRRRTSADDKQRMSIRTRCARLGRENLRQALQRGAREPPKGTPGSAEEG